MQDNPHPSALLRCLSRLDVDTWAQVLLPKLVAQGSAGDAALTCSQLRDLCFAAVQHINLSSVQDDELIHVEDWVLTIPQHFQNAKSVQLLLNDEASYHRAPYLLPMLARLPKLDIAKLRVEGDLRPMSMGTVLYSLRTQLAGRVCSLHLDLRQSWAGAAQAWRELGKHTGLTKLVLEFSVEVAAPLDEHDLLPLASLHSLQELKVKQSSKLFCQPLLSAQLAGGLTSLTSLFLSGCPIHCLEHVSSCAALRELVMECPGGWRDELSADEWAAVGELTGLVDLQLYNAEFLTPTDECCAAVSKLTGLQRLGAWKWSAEILPALTACTQLTNLSGGWYLDGIGAGGVLLPSVVELGKTCGSPRFAALPNLVIVQQSDGLSADAFARMALHCTRLRELLVTPSPNGATFARTEPERARMPALKALSALTGLTSLDCVVVKSVDLMAVVDLVGTLLPKGFQRLRVGLTTYRPFGVMMQLAKLQGLPELQLHVRSTSDVIERSGDVLFFLSALSGIRRVEVIGLKSQGVDAWLAAHRKLEETGLPCIHSLSVEADAAT